MKHGTQSVPGEEAPVDYSYLVEQLRGSALYFQYFPGIREEVRGAANAIEKLTEDRDYWRSRTYALEAERRALLLRHGVDLGERPALDGEHERGRLVCERCGAVYPTACACEVSR